MAAAVAEQPTTSGDLESNGLEISNNGFVYRQYTDERDLPYVMHLVDNELSEPYSIFTYRYFLQSWPSLCFLVLDGDQCFGTVVCKLDNHRDRMRGYVAMLVVEQKYRHKGVGTQLVVLAIKEMQKQGCDEVTLEAEVSNRGALKLYQNLGFIRDKRLHRYYLNGADAFRLKLLLPPRLSCFTAPPGPSFADGSAHKDDIEDLQVNESSTGSINTGMKEMNTIVTEQQEGEDSFCVDPTKEISVEDTMLGSAAKDGGVDGLNMAKTNLSTANDSDSFNDAAEDNDSKEMEHSKT